MRLGKKYNSACTAFYTAIFLFVMAAIDGQQVFAQSSLEAITPSNKSISSISELLDGLQFKAGIVRADDDTGNALGDTLIFSDGKFSSIICKRYNFAAAPYWIRTEGKRIHFMAELNSPTDGKMIWKGTISGDKLAGTMRWTKKRWYWTVNAEHAIEGEVDFSDASAPTPQ